MYKKKYKITPPYCSVEVVDLQLYSYIWNFLFLQVFLYKFIQKDN